MESPSLSGRHRPAGSSELGDGLRSCCGPAGGLHQPSSRPRPSKMPPGEDRLLTHPLKGGEAPVTGRSGLPGQAKPAHRRGGFILLVVLGVVLALSALLFGFAQTTRTSLGKAAGFYRSEQARTAAWGGLQTVIALIRDVKDFWADPQTARLLTGPSTVPIGDANCAVTITEESGLLNVNHLLGPDGRPDRRRIDQFLRLIDILNRRDRDLPPIGYGIAAALVDWLDRDDDLTHLAFVQRDNLGAEDAYYQTCTPPYPCRNGPLDALEELLAVKGMTPTGFARLRPYLTCRGDGKIDLNAAPPPVLESLSEQMDPTLAQMIARQRALKPFRSPADLRRVPGMTDSIRREIEGLLTTNPSDCFYRVRAQGAAQDYQFAIEALLQRNADAGVVEIVQYREL
jgi:type II secretory pathway component PulK